MIIDLRKKTNNPGQTYDIVIIGAGPVGITLANEFRNTNLNIAVLESGGKKVDDVHDQLRETICNGISIKDHSRERVLGGASTTWSGLSSPLDPIDYKIRSFVPLSGWPLKAEELESYYDKAAAHYHFPEMDLYRGDGFKKVKEKGDLQLLMTEVSEKIFLAKETALDFGTAFKDLFTEDCCDLFLDATVTKLVKSDSNDSVVAVDVISSLFEKIRVDAKIVIVATGGLENPRLLLQSDLGNTLDQVGRYMMNHPKNNFGVIKLKKPAKDSPYYFGCMVDGNVGYAGLRLSEEVQVKKEVLNSYVRFEPLFPWTDNIGVEALVALVKNAQLIIKNFSKLNKGKVVSLRDYSETGDDSELQSGRKGYFHFLKLFCYIAINPAAVFSYLYYRIIPGAVPGVKRVRLRNFMEMAPVAENRVTLGSKKDIYGLPLPAIAHKPSELDKRSLRELHKNLKDEIQTSGVGKLISTLDTVDPWPVDHDASHHLGTTRMGDNPETSVVDKDCKIHGIKNVFMAGGSVFPTSSCVNPTFTMVALSIRLADFLKLNMFNIQEQEQEQEQERDRIIGQRSILIIGAGKRVQEAALPALQCLPDYSIHKVFAKNSKNIQTASGELEVYPFAHLQKTDIEQVDLIYLAVKQQNVVEVLTTLSSFDLSGVDLLIETPVIPFDDMGHLNLFETFRNVWVAEDCTKLPCFDVVPKKIDVQEIHLDRSGYKYHAIALMKKIFNCQNINKVSREKKEDGVVHDTFHFSSGKRGVVTSPRDYDSGTFSLKTAEIIVSDFIQSDGKNCLVEPILENERCKGFKLQDRHSLLDENETKLMGSWEKGTSITSKMHDLKRVGLYRMFKDILDGKGSYPLMEAIQDMKVSYYLDSLGFYKKIFLLESDSKVAKLLCKILLKIKLMIGRFA